LVLGITFIIAISVSAAPPVVENGGADIDYEVTDSVCPGIIVNNHEVFTYRQITWYDNLDNPVKIETHFSGTDNFYNPANPGVVLSGHFTGNYRYNVVTGEEATTGVPWHITVPGYGTVRVRAGRWSGAEGLHLAGKDSFVSAIDTEQFCSCLAGD